MAGVFPNVAEDFLLSVASGLRTPEDWQLRLYASNTYPAEADTTATYTEATGGSYAAITLSKGSWANSVNAGAGQIAYAQQTYTFSAGIGNIYGYYITAASNTGLLIMAERFSDAPVIITNNGDQIKITPVIQGN